ncbi:MAG: polyprenyl diphosphate synthase [Armatimonadota bacterium]
MAITEEMKERLAGLKMPEHVGIIMDGNGRWAERHGLSHLEGHAEGRKATRRVIQAASDFGISVLSLYAFSTENWSRSDQEISGIMHIIEAALMQELNHLHRTGIRVYASGRLHQLPESLQETIREAIELTAENTDMKLNLCINYGGRAEIVDAARAVSRDVLSGELAVDDIDDAVFSGHLYNPELPDLDLIIRSSGELRISNFLLWQGAYCEFVSQETLWPDFNAEYLLQALEEFSSRDRRFGGRQSQGQ